MHVRETAAGGGDPQDEEAASCDGTPDKGQELRTRYQAAYVPGAAACVSQTQTRTCNDGTWSAWSGDFSFEDCVSVPGDIYYVDIDRASCSDENAGDMEDAPFCSIGKSVEQVGPGDYVLVKEGVYREKIQVTTSGEDSNPIVFEAFNGEDVVLDGSVVIDGWTRCASRDECFDNPHWQDIYHMTISFQTDKLFEDDAMMTNAREPDFGYFRSTKSDTDMSVFSDSITEPSDYYTGALAEFQGTTTTAMNDRNNLVYDKYYVINAEPGRLYFDYSGMTPLWGHSFDDFLDEMWFYVRNKVQYIDRPGEWALIDCLGAAPYTLYFWAPSGDPGSSKIEAAYHNTLISSNGIIENIQFNGIDTMKVNKYPQANNGGVYTFRYGARNIVIQNSAIMFAEKAIEIRHPDGLIIRNNTMLKNYDAIVIGSGLAGPVGDLAMSFIEDNDIGPNGGDGIQIYSESNITIRNNHIHHHYSDRKHADNVQMNSVRNIFVENNRIHDSGQNIIMQNTDTATIKNNVIYNSHARSLILDDADNQNLQLTGNTIGFSYYTLLIKFSNTTMKNNAYILGAHQPAFYIHDYLDRIDASDYNYYADSVTMMAHGNPWTSYSIEEWQALGFDQSSLFGGSTFANIPSGVYMADFLSFYERDNIKIIDADTIFTVGDIIEYANDGVPRTVTSVQADSIGIDPPLNYDNIGSLWGNYIVHWGNNQTITEDYTPAGVICSGAESGGAIGAVSCE